MPTHKKHHMKQRAGEPQFTAKDDSDGAESSSSTLVDAFEKGSSTSIGSSMSPTKKRIRQELDAVRRSREDVGDTFVKESGATAAYSPTKKKIEEELDAVRRIRGRSPVAKLAGKFDKASQSPVPRGTTGTDQTKPGKGEITSGPIVAAEPDSEDSQDDANMEVVEQQAEDTEIEEPRPNTAIVSLNYEGSDDSSDSVSTNADTEEEDVQAAVALIEKEDGVIQSKETVYDDDDDVIFASQDPEDDDLEEIVDQKDEKEPLMTNSASSSRKADEQPDTGVLVDINPAHAEMGWGWLAVVGLVCALGIAYIQRIKRRS